MPQEALKITAELNASYHTPQEIRELIPRLIGKSVDDSFVMFPPFYTDCGKNITIGKCVFINAYCCFQEQGGIIIGGGALIGRRVALAALNQNLLPEKRSFPYSHPLLSVKLSGLGPTRRFSRGVVVGGAIVVAGVVATKNVESNTIAGGVPACPPGW